MVSKAKLSNIKWTTIKVVTIIYLKIN